MSFRIIYYSNTDSFLLKTIYMKMVLNYYFLNRFIASCSITFYNITCLYYQALQFIIILYYVKC